jgi:hypothetical protein
MWVPEVVTMKPRGSTDCGWQVLQVAAVGVPVSGGCPVGGIPWQEAQVIGVVSVQIGVAFAPETPLKLKFPWQ